MNGLQAYICKLVITNVFSITCCHQSSPMQPANAGQLKYFEFEIENNCEWMGFDNTSTSEFKNTCIRNCVGPSL